MLDYNEEVKIEKRHLNALLKRQADCKKDICGGFVVIFIGYIIARWSLDVNFWAVPVVGITFIAIFIMIWGFSLVWKGFMNTEYKLAVFLTKLFGKKTLSAEIWECKMKIIELEQRAERISRRKELSLGKNSLDEYYK